jgi:type IV secretory pathway TrbL component
MKSFGKFVTFVGVTGAALAGLWYFLEVNKDKSYAEADGASDTDDFSSERSYVSLDPEIKEELKEDVQKVADGAKKAAEDVKKAAEDIKDNAAGNKDTLKKAVKSAAQDIIAKAEDAAKGVGLVKEEKKTSDFEFEDFDKASHIDIE